MSTFLDSTNVVFTLTILLMRIRNHELNNDTLRSEMTTHLASSELKFPPAMYGLHNNTIRVFQKCLSYLIMREHITLMPKAKHKAPVGLVIQDIKKEFFTRCQDRERTTEINMEEITDK